MKIKSESMELPNELIDIINTYAKPRYMKPKHSKMMEYYLRSIGRFSSPLDSFFNWFPDAMPGAYRELNHYGFTPLNECGSNGRVIHIDYESFYHIRYDGYDSEDNLL